MIQICSKVLFNNLREMSTFCTTISKPTANNQTTNNQQPTTNNQQLTTNNEQLTTNSKHNLPFFLPLLFLFSFLFITNQSGGDDVSGGM
jgi:hypothetical protein